MVRSGNRWIGRLGLAGAMLISPSLLLAQAGAGQEQATAQATGQATTQSGPSLALSGHVRGVRSAETASQQLAIEVLNVEVRIRGGIAETRMTATFRNSGRDVLEGDFLFDMPAGAVISGYALDVGPDLIDGVLAGRDQAREAYQRRVAQRIDPGLAEVSYADRFSTRIFPIPAGGSRTIRLVMASPVDPISGYRLPLRPAGPVGRFQLHIEHDAAAQGQPPRILLPDGVRGSWRDGELSAEAWDVRLGGTLSLTPAARVSPVIFSRHSNGQTFFELDAALPDLGDAADSAAPVHIFWDRSISRVDDDRAAERALVLAHLRATGAPIAALTVFDSSGTETSHPASIEALGEALSAVDYGGGSSFAVLKDVPVDAGALCLLISDGRSTIDSRAGFALPCRTFAIASGREVDRGWLADVADRSGGSLIELASTSQNEALRFLAVRGADLGQIVDRQSRAIDAVRMPATAGRFRLIGPMPEDGIVRIERQGRVWRTFEIGTAQVADFSPTGALWASRRIAAVGSEMPVAEMVAMSRRYSVASPMASFIVLENPADYVEANIAPPATYPKALTDQWAALRASADRSRELAQAGRLDQVAALWADQQGWWATDFSAQQRQQAPNRRDERAAVQPAPVMPSAPPPPPPPPPPAPPPPPPPLLVPPPPVEAIDVVTDSANIVVTASRIDADRRSAESAREDQLEDANAQAASAVPDERAGQIELAEWSSDRPWVAAFEAAGTQWQAEVARQRVDHGLLPIFWFDLAEWHFTHGRLAEARRAAESALDLEARDNQTLAIVSARLQRYGGLDRAIWLIEQLIQREDERPQPLRTLAVLLMQRAQVASDAGNPAAARADLERAIALLADAVLTVRRENYWGFEQTALMDANLAVSRYLQSGGAQHALPERLIALLDTDIRIVVEWNTPRTDLDLWVEQPDGEDVGYSNRLSQGGGQLTADVTNGFGPEEFLLRRAGRGTYVIRANTFASDQTNPNGPSTLSARIIRNFGRANQSELLIDIEMSPDEQGGRQLIGRIVIE